MNVKYRLRFTKLGKIVYIGHLDLLKLFQRCIKRCGLPIAYSQGFNPHQLEVFAAPLSLGTSSTGEYVDVALTQSVDADEIKLRLTDALPQGIDILSARELPEGEKNCAAAICAADYEITLDRRFENIGDCIDAVSKSESIVMKRIVKHKEKTVDIAPMIYGISADSSGEKTVLRARLAAGSQSNLKTDLLLEYIYGLLGEELVMYKIRTKRTQMYGIENGEFKDL